MVGLEEGEKEKKRKEKKKKEKIKIKYFIINKMEIKVILDHIPKHHQHDIDMKIKWMEDKGMIGRNDGDGILKKKIK